MNAVAHAVAFPYGFVGTFIEAGGSSLLAQETPQPSLRFRRDFP